MFRLCLGNSGKVTPSPINSQRSDKEDNSSDDVNSSGLRIAKKYSVSEKYQINNIVKKEDGKNVEENEKPPIQRIFEVPEEHKWIFNIYGILRKFEFGKVLRVKHDLEDEKMFQVKLFDRIKYEIVHGEGALLERFQTIKHFYKKCKSPFIPKCKFIGRFEGFYWFGIRYVHGPSLRKVIEKEGPLDEKRVAFYIAELVVLLEKIHSLNFVIRTLSLDTILLDEEGHICLCDVSNTLRVSKTNLCDDRLGEEGFLSPEVLEGKSYSFEADWWSVGIIMYYLLLGKHPFPKYKSKNFDLSKRKLQKFQPSTKKLIFGLLEKDKSLRLGGSRKLGAKKIKLEQFFKEFDWLRFANRYSIPKLVPKLYPISDSESPLIETAFDLMEAD